MLGCNIRQCVVCYVLGLRQFATWDVAVLALPKEGK